MDLLFPLLLAVLAAAAAAALTRAADVRRHAEERGALASRLAAAEQDNTWLRAEIARQQESLESTRSLLDRTDARLRDAFQALAAEALKDNRASFFDLARASFEGYHQPIAETLKKVDARLSEAERDRVSAYARLSEQIAALGSAAGSLTRALRTPAVRGRWGEMQLRRVVEIAGMLERCDFDEQPGLFTENGRLRPDLVVHLPGGKQIVVDAKAPLEAFLDAQETADETIRVAKLQAHARQVREHMDKLGGKAYWEPLDQSPEMVVMFLPGETLFSAALQQDLGLIEHGLRQRVLLASPITLIALLTTVAHSWRQEALAQNYRDVATLGRELYDRLSVLTGHFEDLRKKLDGAVQAYNRAAGSFETRVLTGARKLRDMDVTTAEELPPAEPIDTVPRVLKQAGLMGVPEEATVEPEIT
jgi:DNA recombination protein RmuC